MHNTKEIENIFEKLIIEIKEQTVNFFCKNEECLFTYVYYEIEYTKQLFEYFLLNGNIDLSFEQLEQIANKVIELVNRNKLKQL